MLSREKQEEPKLGILCYLYLTKKDLNKQNKYKNLIFV